MNLKFKNPNRLFLLALAALFLSGALIAATVFVQGTYLTENQPEPYNVSQMMDEVKAYVRSTTEPHPDVTSVVKKYFPEGDSEQYAVRALRNHGFRIRKLNKKYTEKQYDYTIGAGKSFHLVGFIFGHDFAIYLDCNDEKVSRVRASASMSHL